MSRFTGEDPIGRYLPDGKRFQLFEACEFFISKYEGIGRSVIAEVGFITDFASIPIWLQPIIPQYKGRRAAIIHDKLYQTLGLEGVYNRKECDRIFYDALTVLDVSIGVKVALYLGVRLGGWYTWNKYTKSRIRK